MKVIFQTQQFRCYQLEEKQQYLIDLLEQFVPICYSDNQYYIFVEQNYLQKSEIFKEVPVSLDLLYNAILTQVIYQFHLIVLKTKIFYKSDNNFEEVTYKILSDNNILIQTKPYCSKHMLNKNYDIGINLYENLLDIPQRNNYFPKNESIWLNQIHTPTVLKPFFDIEQKQQQYNILITQSSKLKKQKTVQFSNKVIVFGENELFHSGLQKGIHSDDNNLCRTSFNRKFCQKITNIFMQAIE